MLENIVLPVKNPQPSSRKLLYMTFHDLWWVFDQLLINQFKALKFKNIYFADKAPIKRIILTRTMNKCNHETNCSIEFVVVVHFHLIASPTDKRYVLWVGFRPYIFSNCLLCTLSVTCSIFFWHIHRVNHHDWIEWSITWNRKRVVFGVSYSSEAFWFIHDVSLITRWFRNKIHRVLAISKERRNPYAT